MRRDNFILLFISMCSLISCIARPDGAVSEAFDLDVIKQVTNQAPSPGNRGVVRLTALGAQFVSINFSPATDDSTAANLLEYKLEALVDGSVMGTIFDWKKITSGDYQIELESTTAFIYRLKVRDQQKLESAYQLFTHAPILPDQTALLLHTPDDHTMVLSWNKAQHLYIDQQALQYTLLRKTPLQTWEEAVVEINWSNDLSEISLSKPAAGSEFDYLLKVRTPFAVEVTYPSVKFAF